MPKTEEKSVHHSFDIELAAKIGLDEAILYHHFAYWIGHNRRLKRNFKDGRTWTYQSVAEITAHFPYWTTRTVERIIRSLIDKSIIVTANYNKTAWDKTLWYAFKDEEVSKNSYEYANGEIDTRKRGNRETQTGEPIPHTKTDTELAGSSEALAPASPAPAPARTHTRTGDSIEEDRGTLREKKEFLEAIVFPGGARISERNVMCWAKNYSLWRIKKCVANLKRKIVAGAKIEKPEALFATIIKDPGCESTRAIEATRESAEIYIAQQKLNYLVLDDFVVDQKTNKDLSLSLGKERLIEEMERWQNVR